MQLSVLVTLFSCGFSLIFHFGLKKLQFAPLKFTEVDRKAFLFSIKADGKEIP